MGIFCMTKITREQRIEEVGINESSVYQTSITYGLSSLGVWCNWIKQYKMAGYIVVEKRKARPSTMKQPTKKYEQMQKRSNI